MPPVRPRCTAAALALLALCGCPSNPPPPGDGGTSLELVCDAGFVPSDGGRGCMAALAEGCPAGTMPVVGAESCAPVGHVSCELPLVADPSGWGCDWPLPACDAGVTLLDGGCGWPGDCAAEFPPTGATHFVDAAFAAGQLDGTHFLKPSDAVAAAPAGAIIAVERGTYVDAVRFTRANQQLWGRCAAEVVLQSPGGAAAGFDVSSPVSASVRGMRARGHRGGAIVVSGQLTLDEAVLDGNREIGAIVVNGGRLSMKGAAIRGTTNAANGALGRGIDIETGGVVDLTDSTVEDSGEVGIFVQEPGSALSLTRSAVLGTRGVTGGAEGRGVVVRLGASATLVRSMVRGARDLGLFVIGNGSQATLSQTVVRDIARQANGQFGRGISVQPGARATLADVTFRALYDTGLDLVGPGTIVTADRVTVHGVRPDGTGSYGMAAFVRDATRFEARSFAAVGLGSSGITANGPAFLQLEDVLVREVEGDANGLFGFGMLVSDGASVVLDRVSLGPVRSSGIFTLEGQAFVNGRGVFIDQVRPEAAPGERFGQGLTALPGSRIDLTDSVIRAAAVTGAAFAGAGGSLTRCELRGLPVGLFVQDGSTLQSGSVPGAPAATDVWVDDATLFLGVTSNVGLGVVPLPDPTGSSR